MNINKKYQDLLHKIYSEGFEYEDPNRKGVKRKQISSYTLEHDFKDGFPLLGLKQTYPKMAFNEMKVFMQGKTNLKDLEDLGVTFWRKDAYNYYLRFANIASTAPLSEEEFLELLMQEVFYGCYTFGELGRIYSHQIRNWNGKIDQLNTVLERLEKEPNSTKNIITMWNPSDMDSCALSPCHTRFSFVVENLSEGVHGLRIQWSQDSVDCGLGLPINILYYSFTCYVFAHYLGMKPLGVIGNLTNLHLYDNSFEVVEKLLELDISELEPLKIETDFPKEWKDLDDYLNKLDFKNIKILNYKHLGRFDIEMLAYEK
jgi:thymidylate synthase